MKINLYMLVAAIQLQQKVRLSFAYFDAAP